MSYSIRLKCFFLICVIGFASAARVALALPIGLFSPVGGLADVANELSIVAALLAACRLTKRFKSYYAKRTMLRVMEAGWVKWLAALDAQKSTAIATTEPYLKKVA